MLKKYSGKLIAAFILILLIIYLIMFLICWGNISEFKSMLKSSYSLMIITIAVSVAVLYLFFPDSCVSLIKRKVKKEVDDNFGADGVSADSIVPYTPEPIKKIEESERKPDLKIKKLDKTDKKFGEELEELINSSKYEVALARIDEYSRSNRLDEIAVRISRDFVYFSFPNKPSLQDILDNLIKLLANPKLKQQPLLQYATLVRLFQCYSENNDYSNALSVSDQLISSFIDSKIINNEQHFLMYYNRALLCEKMKDNILAISYYNKAKEYVADDYFVLYSIACIYIYALANVNKAIDYLEQLMGKTTDDKNLEGHAINTYAYCMAYLGNFQSAYYVIDNFLRTNPDTSLEIAIALKAKKSYISFKLGNIEEACSLANQVLTITPKDDTSINVLSMIKLKEKDFQAAIEYTNSIIPYFEKEFSRNSIAGYYLGEIFYHRGTAYLELNEKQKAREDFEKANKLNFDEMDACHIIKASIKDAN